MIWMSFLIGIGGSIHCLGMCGPISLALPLHGQNAGKALFNRMAYHLGRIITYGIMGLIVGTFGFGIALAGVQKYISIAIGVWLIVYILFSPQFSRFSKVSAWISPWLNKVKFYLGKYLKAKGISNRFILGMLNGLLPCGLIYIALANTILADHPFEGMVYMMAFGAGTIPSLLLLPFVSRMVNFKKLKLSRWVPVLIFGLGIFLIYRGAAFEYPFFTKAGEIITSCFSH